MDVLPWRDGGMDDGDDGGEHRHLLIDSYPELRDGKAENELVGR